MVFGLATGGVVFLFTGVYGVCERLAKQIIVKGGYPLMLLIGGFLLGGIGYVAPQAVGPGYQMFTLLTGGSADDARRRAAAPNTLDGCDDELRRDRVASSCRRCCSAALGARIVGTVLMPSMTPVFVLMGMAAFSAGVHKMMLTPIVFIAEVYGAPTIIPIILATVVCFFVSGAYSFYPIQPTNKVSQEELALERFYYKVMRSKPKELEKLTAKDVATPNPISPQGRHQRQGGDGRLREDELQTHARRRRG